MHLWNSAERGPGSVIRTMRAAAYRGKWLAHVNAAMERALEAHADEVSHTLYVLSRASSSQSDMNGGLLIKLYVWTAWRLVGEMCRRPRRRVPRFAEMVELQIYPFFSESDSEDAICDPSSESTSESGSLSGGEPLP